MAQSENDSETVRMENKESLLQYICDNVIGENVEFTSPYGTRKVVYCDYTASGRALRFVEDFIQAEVLPFYGNTHTTTTVTSLQTTHFRHEARDIIRNAVNASEHDSVIFCGNGCTGAVHKLINSLDLKLTEGQQPVVFVGPFEHHSNILPWREAGAKVIRIGEAEDGTVDLEDLELQLKKHHSSSCLLIGCFSAASNITGILTDTIAVTLLLRKYNALSFWDYATAGPYIKIDMNPVVDGVSEPLVSKDAIFLSPHKFVGGTGCPGILVAKKKLFKNPVPTGCGGGTVFFVSRTSHRYLQENEMREEGGTPNIVGSIRAGLVFQLKERIGTETIIKRDEELVEWGLSELATHPNIILLGDCHAKRLPIFSFLIRHPETGRFLHYNYVCSLLNDLFGIQTRGGCMCAGPYAQDLLGIDEQLALKIESLLLEDSRLNRVHLRRYHECSGNEILRPGLVRFNLPYFIPNDTISFILQAIQLVADNGWKLLPQYNFNPETGEWRHQQQHQALRDRVWLGNISYVGGKVSFPEANSRPLPPKDFEDSLKLAIEVFETAHKGAPQLGDQTLLFNEEGESMRWFLLPSEAQQILNGQMHHSTVVLPFYPRCTYKRSTGFSVVVAKDINPTTPSLEFNYCSSLQECSDDVSQCHTMIESFKDSQEPDKPQWLYDTCEFEYSDTKVNSPLCWQPKGSSKCEQDRSMLSIENETCTQHASEEQQTQPTGRNDKPKFFSPPKKIMKQTIQAIDDYDMIQNGDSILVGVSGGKDSLSLLHTLRQYQFYAKSKGVHFKLGAVTVDPQTSSYDPSPLKVYLAGLEIPYFYEEQGIIEQASQLAICNSICSFCSRMKRGRLYACLRHEGYNVLALGQHLDDLAESFIMSVFHNGLLRTMKAHYMVTEGDLRVIRPFVYVRERDLRSFAASAKLPVIPENCPACFEAPTERHRTKQLLAAQEILFPNLYQSFQSALKPLMSINRTGMESRLLSSVQSTLKARQDIFDESL